MEAGMSRREEYEERTESLLKPIAQAEGVTIYDVEYVKEAGVWFLRLYIDKEGGVNILDCEAVSRAVSDLLDEADPIEGSYTFEVSSAGADRALKKPEHFAKFLPEYANLEEMKEHYRRGGLGDGTCKKFLYNIMEDILKPIRERRASYEQNIPLVYEILRKGSEVARVEAAKTLADVRKAMKIDYFDDAELIAEHTLKYRK